MDPLATLVRRTAVRGIAAVSWVALRGIEHQPAARRGATDLRTFRVNDLVELRARWIDRPGEVGPTWSAFAGRHELVRVDLFPGVAHMHPAMGQLLASNAAGERHRIAGDRLDEVVASGVDECRRNLAYHAAVHPWRRARAAAPTPDEQEVATAWLEATIEDLVAAHSKAS